MMSHYVVEICRSLSLNSVHLFVLTTSCKPKSYITLKFALFCIHQHVKSERQRRSRVAVIERLTPEFKLSAVEIGFGCRVSLADRQT